jgi:hypothetical protein
MKVSKNEKGFGVIELLLLLIFIAIVTFIGLYVAHNHSGKTTNLSNTTNNKSGTTSKSGFPDGQPANENAQAASSRALIIITGLQTATEGTQTTQGVSPASYVDSSDNQGDFTAGFKGDVDNGTALNISGQEGVSCTNNFPGTFVVENDVISGSTAIVTLGFSSDGNNITNSYSQIPKVTLTYANNNWSVSGYSCITNPSQS